MGSWFNIDDASRGDLSSRSTIVYGSTSATFINLCPPHFPSCNGRHLDLSLICLQLWIIKYYWAVLLYTYMLVILQDEWSELSQVWQWLVIIFIMYDRKKWKRCESPSIFNVLNCNDLFSYMYPIIILTFVIAILIENYIYLSS